MPSKSRGGLSRREYAAKQSGKPMPYASSGGSSSKSSSGSSYISPNSFGSFKFDPNKYLPGFQAEASAIYDPRVAQLNAVRELNKSALQQTEVTNRAELATRLKSEIEAINRRGAFFSGGALTKETDIRTNYDTALANERNVFQQKDLGIEGEIGSLRSAQAQYVRDLLSGAQGSAYNQWKDARDFAYQVATGNRTAQMTAEQNAFENNLSTLKYQGSRSSGGSGGYSDKEFNSDVESLRSDVLMGRINREQAAQTLRNKYGSAYPGVGDAIYLALPDGYTVKSQNNLEP